MSLNHIGKDAKNNEADLLQNSPRRFERAYRVARDTWRARERFDAWAKNYDRDVQERDGWNGPQATLASVLRYVEKSATVLDAGAGTGLMGALLKERGYQNLTATDISRKMLDVAHKKNIYSSDFVADLTQSLPVDACQFDCVLSVGVSGYMIHETLRDFVRILTPGGHLIYTISDEHFSQHGFIAVVEALVSQGLINVVEKGPLFATLPKSDPNHFARVHVYQKLATNLCRMD